MNGLSIEITDAQERLMRAHAEEDYPHECCGILIGNAGASGQQVAEVVKIINRREENRERRFLISPEDYREAEARAKELDAEVIGFYHSHPDHPAIPSEFDREHALPFISYIIVSVREGESAELRSWQLTADRAGYDEEKVFIKDTIDS